MYMYIVNPEVVIWKKKKKLLLQKTYVEKNKNMK